MNDRFPADPYRDNVLVDCFADAKRFFLEYFLDVDRAHAVMLAEQNIISMADCRTILAAIEALDVEAIRGAEYDGSVEDLFFWLQREIARIAGNADVAGRLHTARSRNDIDVTIYRLHLRRLLLDLIAACQQERRVLFDLAAQHHESLMPAHTHTQPAQPTTVAHFLLAMSENAGRDVRRLLAAFDNLNRCPLGACAITTTGFPISRERVAGLLGFDGPTENSYASIASVDYFTELLGAAATLLVNSGRFAQEFLLMSMVEFDALRLPDGYVQVSSIMPQKRNPVAMEHVRALASKALGQVLGVLTSVHNTPFGDINDVEDDLQPLLVGGIRDAIRAVTLLTRSLEAASFNTAKLEARAGEGFITVTELADTIVRDAGLPFSVAHRIVARCVARATESGDPIGLDMVQDAAKVVYGAPLPLTRAAVERAISPLNFVTVRSILGGPAPAETRRALGSQREVWEMDQDRLVQYNGGLDAAASRLRAAVAAATAGHSTSTT